MKELLSKSSLILFIIFTALQIMGMKILPNAINTIVYVLVFGCFIADYITEKRWRVFRWQKSHIIFIAMLAMFILSAIYVPFSEAKYYGYLMEARIPLAAFGLIGIVGVNHRFKLQYFLNTFIITSVSVILWNTFANVGVQHIFTSDFSSLFAESRKAHINIHTWFNLYLNISIIAILHILISSWKSINEIKKVLYVLSFIIIYATLLISEGRTGFLMCNLLIGLSLFFLLYQKYKKWALLSLSLIPIGIGLIMGTQQVRIDAYMNREARIFFWTSAIELIKEKPMIGYGVSGAQMAFDEVRTKNMPEEWMKQHWGWEAEKVRYIDCHNQILQSTLEFGFFGLLLLLTIYFSPLLVANKGNVMLFSLICFAFLLQGMFEVYVTDSFARFFGLVWVVALCSQRENTNSTQKNHNDTNNINQSIEAHIYKSVKVLVPIYKEVLSEVETLLLTNNMNILSKYEFVFVIPEGLNISSTIKLAEAKKYSIKEVSPKWLGTNGIKGYNEMMLSHDFYDLFSDSEYILICQTDVEIFSDKLSYWCNKGYDYIGAPWIKSPFYNTLTGKIYLWTRRYISHIKSEEYTRQDVYNKVGNGGLSLRKVESMKRYCLEYRDTATHFLSQRKSIYNEDVFWALIPQDIKLPHHIEALEFSFDKRPKLCYEMNGNRLPFGAHGVTKGSCIRFWRDKSNVKL